MPFSNTHGWPSQDDRAHWIEDLLVALTEVKDSEGRRVWLNSEQKSELLLATNDAVRVMEIDARRIIERFSK